MTSPSGLSPILERSRCHRRLRLERSVAIILDDDEDPDLSVYGPSTYEGDSGVTEFTFDAYLTRVADTDVTFEWSTLDGDAAAGSDYVAAVDRGATIPAGQASATFTVTVNGDEEIEDDESFAYRH